MVTGRTLAVRLNGAEELMDLPGVDRGELAGALRGLAQVNRFLGGARAVLAELPPLVDGLPGPVRILDVATGFGDIPRAIVRWARRRRLPVEVECLDRNPESLELAAAASASFPEMRFTRGDALSLPHPAESFDVVLSSLFLHHLEGDEPVRFLREMLRVARRGALVNDLRRGRWPFLATWISLHLMSRNRYILYDGPISIRRSYREPELRELAEAAGWRGARVKRHAFFRQVLTVRKDEKWV
jgi:ubiquinone/menaquinone biosynthesis C-methylase UbiE